MKLRSHFWMVLSVKRFVYLPTLALVFMHLLSACGNSSASISALDLFDSTNTPPALDIIIPVTSTFTALASGFSASNPRWNFTTGSGYGGSFLAPAAGVVTDIGSDVVSGTTVTYVRIMHSGLLSTKVYGVQLPNVRPGDSVVSGQNIGNFINAGQGQIAFEVRYRDVAVCPLSYVSQAFRTNLASNGYYTLLCQ